jgi:NADH-quinone oxidoreductase subunit H
VGPHRAGIPLPAAILDAVPMAAFGALGAAGLTALLCAMCFGALLIGGSPAGLLDGAWRVAVGLIVVGGGVGIGVGLNGVVPLNRFSGALVAVGGAALAGSGVFEGSDTPNTIPLVGIEFGTGTLMVVCGILTVLQLAAGVVLPELFEDGKLTAFGGLHPLADVISMIWKEDWSPPNADKLLYSLAPIIALIPAFATFAVIPFGPTVHWEHLFHPLPVGADLGVSSNLQIASVSVGILYMFAIAGTGIVGAAIAGYSSDNKFALLGGLRAAGQMVSYEVTLGLSLVGVFMLYDTLLLEDMVHWQMEHVWGVFLQPLAFVLFLVASIAEYKRVPFDVPEGESEIVAGYFLEYSGFKWGMFMTGEFVEIIVSGALISTLFFGGYHVPFLGPHGWEAFGWQFDLGALDGEGWQAVARRFHVVSDVLNTHAVVVLFQIGAFLAKTIFFCWLSLMVRWTMPRFRYDQIMQLCWKVLLPASLANILITGIAILLFNA